MNKYIIKQSLKNNTRLILMDKEVNHQMCNKKNYANIKKIHCYNTNKEVAYHLFKKQLFFKYKKIKNFKKILKIKKVIYSIKKSGFFSYIKTFQSKNNIEGFISFIITAKVNPIIKQIKISNYYNLQIPSVLVKRIFIHQVGLPENYKKLQKSIEQIHDWYISHGFKFIQIRLIRTNCSGQLLLNINEGIIGKIEIISMINTSFNQKIISNIQTSIDKELNLRTGQPLNIKKLEMYLVYLKKQKFLQDCNYTTYLHKNLIYLKIYFNIIPTPKMNLYLLNQNCHNRSNFLKHLCQNSKFEDLINHNNMIVQIQQLYLYIKRIQQDLGFHYCFISQNKYTNYLKIKAQIDKQLYRIINCTYKHIHLYIQQARIFYLTTIEVDHKIHNSKIFYPFIHVVDKNRCYSIIHELQAKLNSLSLIFHHKLIQEVSISENIAIRSYLNNKNRISITHQYINNIQHIFNDISSITIKFKKYLQVLHNRLIYIELFLKYNSLYLIDSLPIGSFMVIYSKLFYSIKPNSNAYIKNHQYLGQVINSTFINHYYIPNILPGIYKSILVSLIDIKYVVKKTLITPVYCNNDYELNDSNFNRYKGIIQYYSCLLKTEFHLYKWKYISIYFFCDFNNNENSIKYNIKLLAKTMNEINLKHKGIGIQLNIPIKNLANINIKYNKSNKNRSSVRITNYSKYN